MFHKDVSLYKLPDLSKWDLSNAKTFESMFAGCSSLIIFPNISNWKICKAKNMYSMFAGCYSLQFLDDISKWEIKKAIKGNIFGGCLSLMTKFDN